MDTGSATEILSFKGQIADRVNDLTNLMEQAPLEPVCTADTTVWCIDSAKFVTMCQSVCHVFCSPNSPNCVVTKSTRHYIDDKGKPVNAVSVTVSLQDRHGNAVIGQCEHLEVTSDLVSHVTVKEQDEGGVYKITYRPISIEADDVMIKWNEHDIIQCNVPALMRDYTTLRVVKPVEEENDEEEEEENYEEVEEEDDEEVEEEYDEEVEEEDDDVMIKWNEHDIIQCSVPALLRDYTTLRLVKPVEKEDDEEVEEEDDDVIIKWNEHDIIQCNVPVLMRDYTTLRVVKPVEEEEDDEEVKNSDNENSMGSEEDNQLETIASYGPDEVKFGEVRGMCNGPNDELIVADETNNKLIVFDKDLQYSHTIGRRGKDDGQFSGPRGVVCDKAGRLFVADYGNNRVQVFKLSGEYVTTIGTKGSGDGEFSHPTRLAVSSTGLLFVCDVGNQRTQVFDTQQKQFQYSFAQGKVIMDLTLNATEDKLFAVDCACIQVYTPQGQFLHSIAVDPTRCGVFTISICSTPDGHLLVGTYVSPTFLSVYHEDGTLVASGDNGMSKILQEMDSDEFIGCTSALNATRNGQIMAFYNSKIVLL